MCERLKAKGFASTNIVFGIGSFQYQYNTRDTFGFAMKATYGELFHQKMGGEQIVNNVRGIIEPREIFKDPITDDGTKKSKKGLLQVYEVVNPHIPVEENGIFVKDQATWEEEGRSMLKTVFKDGVLVRETTLEQIRTKLNNQ